MFNWSNKRILALGLVIEGEKTQAEIADACGKCLATVKNWIKQPEFEIRRKEIEEGRVEEAKRLFQAYAVDAAKQVIKLSKDSNRDDSVKLQASMAILAYVGISPVTKIAPTNPDGTQEYGNIDKQLFSKLLSNPSDGSSPGSLGNPDTAGKGTSAL
jgi:hypothetical protein